MTLAVARNRTNGPEFYDIEPVTTFGLHGIKVVSTFGCLEIIGWGLFKVLLAQKKRRGNLAFQGEGKACCAIADRFDGFGHGPAGAGQIFDNQLETADPIVAREENDPHPAVYSVPRRPCSRPRTASSQSVHQYSATKAKCQAAYETTDWRCEAAHDRDVKPARNIQRVALEHQLPGDEIAVH